MREASVSGQNSNMVPGRWCLGMAHHPRSPSVQFINIKYILKGMVLHFA